MTRILAILLPVSLLIWSQPVSGDTQRLINTKDMYPSPSPDGQQLVFQSNRVGGDQVFLMNLDENFDPKQLTNFALGAETPVFSPDGEHIVFSAYVGEDNNDVHLINADGSGLAILTTSPGYDGHPHFSADGKRIVFNSDRSSPDPNADWSDRWHEIYSMNLDGSDIVQHTRCESVCTYGSISPDGQKVLYRKVVSGNGFNWALQQIERNSEIFISDLDGSNEINISNNAAFDGWPVWSPDGERIAFASNRSGPANTGQIWSMNADGGDLQQITNGPWAHVQPAWAADGKSLFVYQFKETDQYEFGSVVRISIDDDN